MNVVDVFQNIILRYGAGWVLWVLVGLSILVVVIGLERWFYYRRRSGDTRKLAAVLEAHLRSDAWTGAPAWPKGGRALAARVVDAGLALADEGQEPATQAMHSRTALERELLESRLTILGTIGNNAPFVGLLGTVIGIVHAFHELGRSAAVGQQQTAAVMSGIAEALIATAVGLLVAIPAVAVYNYFYRRMASLAASTEVLSRLLLAHIALRRPGPPQTPDGERPTLAEGNDARGRQKALPVREMA